MKKDIATHSKTICPVKTGISGFDEDVAEFYKIIKSDKIAEIKAIASNYDLKARDLQRGIPAQIFKISAFVVSEKVRENIYKSVPKEVHPFLDKLIKDFDKHFSKLKSHPARLEVLKAYASKKELKSPLERKINPIVCLSNLNTWYGNPPELVNLSRIAFADEDDVLLYEFTSDWDNLAYLVNGLSEILCESVDSAKELVTINIVDVPDDSCKRLNEYISTTIEMLEKTRKQLSIYFPSEAITKCD